MSEPSTSEVLAGLVEEMRERSEAFDRGRPTARATYEDGIRAATWRQALALVEAALGRHGAGEVAMHTEWGIRWHRPTRGPYEARCASEETARREVADSPIATELIRRSVTTITAPWEPCPFSPDHGTSEGDQR